MLSKEWMKVHGADGGYPNKALRLQINDEWFEADKEYAASLAPA